MPNWDLDQLRWYKKCAAPSYRLDRWWGKKEVEKGLPDVDLDNPDLGEPDTRNRMQIKLEPWLWEILRRHPDLKSIRDEYRQIKNSQPEVSSDKFSGSFIKFSKQWENRGWPLIESLALWGHLSWASSKLRNNTERGGDKTSAMDDEGRNVDEGAGPFLCLHDGGRQKFMTGIAIFSKAKDNFPNNVWLPSRPSLTRPLIAITAESQQIVMEGPHKFRPKTPWDYTLGEYESAAEKRGRELLWFEVNRGASVAMIVDAVKTYLKRNKKNDQLSGDEVSNRKEMRLTANRLELMIKLDIEDDISEDAVAEIKRIFLEFRLRV
ncbi:MAG: hypothetical protein GXP30_08225 [Verrucomicrobia bacterium]|nr:hypothetical protein [Verrucomicrobiota bacterium]